MEYICWKSMAVFSAFVLDLSNKKTKGMAGFECCIQLCRASRTHCQNHHKSDCQIIICDNRRFCLGGLLSCNKNYQNARLIPDFEKKNQDRNVADGNR